MTERPFSKPDILDCLANLSSDEVFTPPSVVNAMLDMLPQELFANPKAKFLDPFAKSGVFLREIAKRLDKGLVKAIPDKDARIRHIFANQVYGIAITQLTALFSRRSLYCNKDVNHARSTIRNVFRTDQGNIGYHPCKHTWKNGSCMICGASKKALSESADVENYAYPFLHDEAFMKQAQELGFDVVIGNPPYQMRDGGFGTSSMPIYQEFVAQAKKLNSKHLVMIIPARWYAGGKGLDDFRSEMLQDDSLCEIVDYENSHEVFDGVDVPGGICYFHRDARYHGLCTVTNMNNGSPLTFERKLSEYDTFIRNGLAAQIVNRVMRNVTNGHVLSARVSSSKPFGIRTFYEPKEKGVPCWFIQRVGLKFASPKDITDEFELLNKWKLLLPPAPIAGQTDFSKPIGLYYESNVRIAKPGECCTESWIVGGAFPTRVEVESFKSYLFTKVVRFLVLQTVVSQHVTKKNFGFVPDLGKYEGEYTDAKLCKKWGITSDEWQFIDSRIL